MVGVVAFDKSDLRGGGDGGSFDRVLLSQRLRRGGGSGGEQSLGGGSGGEDSLGGGSGGENSLGGGSGGENSLRGGSGGEESREPPRGGGSGGHSFLRRGGGLGGGDSSISPRAHSSDNSAPRTYYITHCNTQTWTTSLCRKPRCTLRKFVARIFPSGANSTV